MALQWNWDDKIGYVDLLEDGVKKFEHTLYKGNALMIEISENKEDNTYSLSGFWGDKEHARNCLGLNKGYNNIYNGCFYEYVWHLDGKHESAFDIAKLLRKAGMKFDITYNGED